MSQCNEIHVYLYFQVKKERGEGMSTLQRKAEKHPALSFSEKLLGQLIGEVMVERRDSVFLSQVLAFGVQATRVNGFPF